MSMLQEFWVYSDLLSDCTYNSCIQDNITVIHQLSIDSAFICTSGTNTSRWVRRCLKLKTARTPGNQSREIIPIPHEVRCSLPVIGLVQSSLLFFWAKIAVLYLYKLLPCNNLRMVCTSNEKMLGLSMLEQESRIPILFWNNQISRSSSVERIGWST